jgi:zinc transporter ZupT
VGLSVRHGVVHSVLPAIWPALVVIVLGYWVAQSPWSGTLLAVVLQAVAGGLLYLALFFSVAIGRRDRALYTEKALEVLGRRGVPSAA